MILFVLIYIDSEKEKIPETFVLLNFKGVFEI